MMSISKNKGHGWSLIEMMVVIALLGVLSTIGAPRYAAYLQRGKNAQCDANMHAIEQENITENALSRAGGSRELIHREPKPWEDRAWAILDRSLSVLGSSAWADTGDYECPSGGVYVIQKDFSGPEPVRVICSRHGVFRSDSTVDSTQGAPQDTDQAEVEEGNPISDVWDFTSMGKNDLDEYVKSDKKDWKVKNKGLEGKNYNSRIYFPNARDEYELSLKAVLKDRKRSGTGYGVLFDTRVDEKSPGADSGFIMQFDKGYGEGKIVFRRRENGREFSPIAVLDTGISDNPKSPEYDSKWWNEDHDIQMMVFRLDANRKQVRVFIDGREIEGQDPVIYESSEGEGAYTGFRVWGGKSEFQKLEISSLRS